MGFLSKTESVVTVYLSMLKAGDITLNCLNMKIININYKYDKMISIL